MWQPPLPLHIVWMFVRLCKDVHACPLDVYEVLIVYGHWAFPFPVYTVNSVTPHSHIWWCQLACVTFAVLWMVSISPLNGQYISMYS